MNNDKIIDETIIDGSIIDGSGSSCYRGRIIISGSKIKEVIKTDAGESSLFISPGFVDIHSHADHFLLIDPQAESKILQGVTTDVIGNCGYSAAPINERMKERRKRGLERFGLVPNWSSISDYFKRLEDAAPALNIVTLIGHGTLRSFLEIPERTADANERLKLAKTAESVIRGGAAGISTGTYYIPGKFADQEEIIEMLIPVADADRVYTAHIRDEGDYVIEALSEVLEVVKKARIRFELSHVKTWSRRNWKKADAMIDRIRNAITDGIDIGMDLYPYTSAATELAAGLGLQGIKDEKVLDEKIRKLFEIEPDLADKIRILTTSFPKCKGKKLNDFESPAEMIKKIIYKDPQTSAAFEELSEINIKKFLQENITSIGSDSSNRSRHGILASDFPHPRAFGTFPRFLSRYSGQNKLFSIEEAVRRITSLPMNRLGIKDRGVIKKGMFADLVVFNQQELKDRATFRSPKTFSSGIVEVWVNGELAVKDGKLTGKRNGKVIRF